MRLKVCASTDIAMRRAAWASTSACTRRSIDLLMIVLPGDIADQLQSANEDVQAARVGRRAAPQALGHEVGRVDPPGAEEQVIGVDAAPLVAAMAQDLAGGDRSMPAGPRQAMGEPDAVAIAAKAVALALDRRLPDPASRNRIVPAVVGDALGD